MKYPLHTTGDLACLPYYMAERGRYAVWVHVGSDDERQWALLQVHTAGWEVVAGSRLPRFFVVAVRPGTQLEDIARLVELICPKQSAADVEFLGQLFGYSAADVAWYLKHTYTTQ
jgi:hypothetical protein